MPTKKTAPKKTAARKAPKRVERNTGEWVTHPKIIVSNVPNAREPSQLDRIEAELKRNASDHGGMWGELAIISAKLDTILASLSQPTVEHAAPQPIGLSPGDYTDASKETADTLTAMGWGWFEGDHRVRKQIMLAYNMKMAHVGGISGDGSNTYLNPYEFIARAAVTAKEIGLVPVEPWVPKVGEWVMVLDTHTNDDAHGTLVNISGTLKDYAYWSGGGGSFKSIRPATDAEVQQHLAEQEAKNPVEFGTRVECRGKTYRIIADNPDTLGFYPMYCNDARAVFHAKRSEFTIID